MHETPRVVVVGGPAARFLRDETVPRVTNSDTTQICRLIGFSSAVTVTI
jgi:hypothetical protein